MKTITRMSLYLPVFFAHIAQSAAAEADLASLAERARWDEVRTVLTEGGDVDVRQADGTSALIWAAYHANAEAARALLEAGADPTVTNRLGMSPLSVAAENRAGDIVALLLAAGADANAPLPEGDTPLMLAARSGSVEAVAALLEHGADVNAVERFHGETALMWAAGQNHADVVRLLLEHGADIEAVSSAFKWDDLKQTGVASYLPRGGLTALLHAARENAIEAADVLLEHGANPNAVNASGISAMRIALTNDHWDLAKLLLDRGADPNDGAIVEAARTRAHPLVRAANNRPDAIGSLEFIRALLDKGADPHTVPDEKMSMQYWTIGEFHNDPALFIAAREADLQMMDLLVEYGAEPAKSTNEQGATLLMAAMGFNPRPLGGGVPTPPRDEALAIQVADAVFALGVDVDAAQDNGMTVLHVAAGKGRNDLIEYLLAKGAKLDIKDSVNRTPLDVAMGIPGPPPTGMPAGLMPPPPVHEATVALLREKMAAAGIEPEPYVAPPPAENDAEAAHTEE